MTEHDPVGSASEEAAKLFGAVTDWARGHRSDVGAAVGSLAEQVAATAQDVDAHLAHGEDCRYCPVCRVVQFFKAASPEVREHLSAAAGSLAQAAAAALATAVPQDRTPGRE